MILRREYNRNMDANNKNFFWGVLLGAAAAAVGGAVALTRSFRTSATDGSASAKSAGTGKRGRKPAAAAQKRKE